LGGSPTKGGTFSGVKTTPGIVLLITQGLHRGQVGISLPYKRGPPNIRVEKKDSVKEHPKRGKKKSRHTPTKLREEKKTGKKRMFPQKRGYREPNPKPGTRINPKT